MMERDGTPASPFRLGGLTGDHPPVGTSEGFSFWVAVAFTINYIMVASTF